LRTSPGIPPGQMFIAFCWALEFRTDIMEMMRAVIRARVFMFGFLSIQN
jgi:hypothetical protein